MYVFLIGQREAPTPPLEQVHAFFFAIAVQEYGTQAVIPGAGGFAQSALQPFIPDAGALPGTGMHNQVHPRQTRFAHVDKSFYIATGTERFAQDGLDTFTHGGVISFPWHIYQARIKTTEGITSNKQTYLGALLNMQSAQGQSIEIVFTGLEQFVPGQGFQRMYQTLSGMAVGLQMRACEYALHFTPYNRDFTRIVAVNLRGEQAEETIFTADFTVLVEALESDVIEWCRTVYGRDGVGFGDDDEFSFPRPCAQFACQRQRFFRIGVAENAEAAGRYGTE